MVRTLTEIADEIYRTWGHDKINYAAKPYLEAMASLTTVEDRYFADSAPSVIRYFLGNATTWRGPDARRIKAELNEMIKGRY